MTAQETETGDFSLSSGQVISADALQKLLRLTPEGWMIFLNHDTKHESITNEKTITFKD